MESEDIKIKNFLARISDIINRLRVLGHDQFANRIKNLEANIKDFSVHTIKSGLVGITSSGKSSVMNILLGTGTQILKEQSKATTNMLVFCSRSKEQQLDIIYEDGRQERKTGKDALGQSIWKYTSEDENPGNKYGVKYLKIGLPTFIIDEDMELADTPGLDAFGHKEHEDLTLREFLPQADLIVYLSSIRSPMKEADRKILNKIMDADQKIIFVQTCKSAVVESGFAEDADASIEKRLEKYKEEFEKLISPYSRLKDAPIVQVETTSAVQYFKNNDKAAWTESGFEELVHVIKSVTRQLQYEYTIKNLKKIVDGVNALTTLLISAVKEEADKKTSIEQLMKTLDKLKKYNERILNTKNQVVSIWKKKIDPAELFGEFQHELARTYSYRYEFNPKHDTEFILKADAIGEKMHTIKSTMLDNLDNARDKFKEYFDDVGLDIRRTDIQSGAVKSFYMPNVQKRSMSGKSLLGAAKDLSVEYIDKTKFIEELKESIEMFLGPLAGHLEWWDKTITFSFVEPLTKKIAASLDDIQNIEKGGDYNEEQYKRLSAFSKELHYSVKEVSALCDMEFIEQRFPVYGKKTTFKREKSGFINMFLQLSSRYYEALFHNYYLAKLTRYTGKSHKSVILIDHNFDSQINFINKLMRLEPETLQRMRAMKPPYVINPQGADALTEQITVEGEFSNALTFYVLGNDDASFEAAAAHQLFERADVIQLIIDDLHRVGSALVDVVERNKFFDNIIKRQDKLLLAYPGGAYFQKGRLHILVDEAIHEMNKIFSAPGVSWFIYEGYEVRYSYFYDIVSQALADNKQPEDCVRQWKDMGIPLDEPFTEDILLGQFAEIA
ncbi:MAG: dynamin family protein [Candidatus Magnetominusculus sp. LBB02]|nr:dynamin family protein [Candidatus Magnetominusculus sp. LBB02]